MLSPDVMTGPLETLSDEQLMLAYVGGGTSTFDVLYARHESALYRFVRRLLGIRLAAEADEVFQEIWARIIFERESVLPDGVPWRTWAFTVAHNLAIDRLRMGGHEVSFYAHDEDGDGLEAARLFSLGLFQGGGSTSVDSTQPSAEELAFWRAAGRRLLACLNELPEDQRAAFLLRHEEGFTVEVLESTLDVGSETVLNRLRFGLKKLRGCMERYLSILERGAANGESNDLHDAHLWRALEHAPDHRAAPDWRLRKAILKQAHDAIGALDPDEAEAELERAAHSGWQSIFARKGRRSRVPWKAAFVVVLIAALVPLIWLHEPVQVPRLAGETARVSTPAAPVKEPESVPPVPAEKASAEPWVELFAISPPVSPPPDAQVAEPTASTASEPVRPPEPPSPPVARDLKAPETAVVQTPPKPEGPRAGTPPAPAAPVPPPGDAVARLTPPDSPAARPPKQDEAAAAPRPPNATQPPAPVAPSPRSSTVRTDETDPPTFDALSQWSRITISRRGGETRSLPRADARELNSLLGSAALSAVGPQALKATPEWRVTLERNGEVLAVFEIAASQVRWREGKTPPATGLPSGPALSALRDALSNAVRPPEAAVHAEAATPPEAAPPPPTEIARPVKSTVPADATAPIESPQTP